MGVSRRVGLADQPEYVLLWELQLARPEEDRPSGGRLGDDGAVPLRRDLRQPADASEPNLARPDDRQPGPQEGPGYAHLVSGSDPPAVQAALSAHRQLLGTEPEQLSVARGLWHGRHVR